MARHIRQGFPLSVALVILAVAIAGGVTSTALAGAANPERQKLIDTTVRFLQESQRPSGGFANPGRKPTQGISAWVALALASAGINPQDQATCGIDALTFLETHFGEGVREEIAWPIAATTAFERELLVVNAAGTDPHDFAGHDLVGEILSRQLPDGSFPYVPGSRGEINDTAFAVLALSPISEPAVLAAIHRASDWLLSQQNDDGAWSWQVKGTSDNVDLTGGVIEALNAAGRHGTDAQAQALSFLHGAQQPDGGFAETGGSGESNVASTAWAVQGLWAAGQDPETWRTASGEPTEEPLDYMESLQQPDGHVRWRQASNMNGIWMTAYVTPAFAGQALPIPTVPRSLPSASALTASQGRADLPASCSEPESGEDGGAPPGSQSPKPGQGVIAGGGGNGAPDFSRPKPQSRGRTPGGARMVSAKGLQPGRHSQTRRGENPRQPAGTEIAEPTDSSREDREPAVVGSTAGDAGGDDPSAPLTQTARKVRARGGREVTGTLIGSLSADRAGKLAFGAPGLRSAGGGGGAETWVAAGIGALALAGAIGGSQWERRRRVALP